jgi:hypothetical protein
VRLTDTIDNTYTSIVEKIDTDGQITWLSLLRHLKKLKKMRVAGRLAADVLEMIEPFVKPGVSTGELDRICNDYIVTSCTRSPPALAITVSRNPSASLLMKWFATAFRMTRSC